MLKANKASDQARQLDIARLSSRLGRIHFQHQTYNIGRFALWSSVLLLLYSLMTPGFTPQILVYLIHQDLLHKYWSILFNINYSPFNSPEIKERSAQIS